MPLLDDVPLVDNVLPAGTYQATLDEIRAKFVTNVPFWPTRERLWGHFCCLLEFLNSKQPSLVSKAFFYGIFISEDHHPTTLAIVLVVKGKREFKLLYDLLLKFSYEKMGIKLNFYSLGDRELTIKERAMPLEFLSRNFSESGIIEVSSL